MTTVEGVSAAVSTCANNNGEGSDNESTSETGQIRLQDKLEVFRHIIGWMVIHNRIENRDHKYFGNHHYHYCV